MRFIAFMVAAAAALHINGIPEVSQSKSAADDEYLRKVFDQYADGDVISAHSAMFVARKVVGDWRGLSGLELDTYVEANFAKTCTIMTRRTRRRFRSKMLTSGSGSSPMHPSTAIRE